ncbi:MAG: hypothetical protein OEZ14_05670 [Acidimicrobiia bacterium]|nr:hypothetical protein [Acidimicrobiia bacterium]MDH5520005.1 hypothetical protein [Acidimicrobiia bacterium]
MPSESIDGVPCRGVTSPYPDDFASLASMIAEHGDELRSLPNVVGIGVGYKVTGGVETHRRCITVFVARKVPASALDMDDRVPPRFHLHLTDVIEASAARAP